MNCEYIDTCKFFACFLSNNPQKAQEIMDQYCKNQFETCSRHRLARVIGESSVPIKLFPDMNDVADQIIINADKARNAQTAHSVTLINNIQPEDIFDFALDLIAESSEIVAQRSYKVKDQHLRKFNMWLNGELQNYYAKIIQVKIKHTGIRGRKRGKNPLTLFLENIRRGKIHHEPLVNAINSAEEICQVHFSSMSTRIALFHGLKSKPLKNEIVSAIDSLLTIEEKQLALGYEHLVERFNNI